MEMRIAKVATPRMGADVASFVRAADPRVAVTRNAKGEILLPRAEEALKEFVKPYVLRKPHSPAVPYTEAERANLAKQVEANPQRPEYAQNYNHLTRPEQAQFEALSTSMAGRPEAQLALQQMLLDGKLTVASKADPSRNLIQALSDAAAAPVADGIEKPLYVSQLMQEVADPVAVSQQHKGTCAATSSGQILWSMKAPTDYVDFVKQLASPEGKATLPNGDSITRPADWRSGNDRGPNRNAKPGDPRNQGRSIPSQLVEPVFMQVAYGDDLYSNTVDKEMSKGAPGFQRGSGGQSQEQSSKLLEALFPGINYTPVLAAPDMTKAVKAHNRAAGGENSGDRMMAWTKDRMLDYLEENARVDDPIRASVFYELSGGHAILITKVREKPASAATGGHKDKWVDYINPWGQYETQRYEAFKKVLTGVIVPDGFWTATPQ